MPNPSGAREERRVSTRTPSKPKTKVQQTGRINSRPKKFNVALGTEWTEEEAKVTFSAHVSKPIKRSLKKIAVLIMALVLFGAAAPRSREYVIQFAVKILGGAVKELR